MSSCHACDCSIGCVFILLQITITEHFSLERRLLCSWSFPPFSTLSPVLSLAFNVPLCLCLFKLNSMFKAFYSHFMTFGTEILPGAICFIAICELVVCTRGKARGGGDRQHLEANQWKGVGFHVLSWKLNAHPFNACLCWVSCVRGYSWTNGVTEDNPELLIVVSSSPCAVISGMHYHAHSMWL